MASELKHSQVMALPNHPSLHAHDYRQVVIGLQGQTEFELSGRGSLVGPGQGCLVSESELHAFSGRGHNEILVINLPDAVLMGELSMKQKVDTLFQRDAYFQLDSQAQVLVKALTAEMVANPDDLILGRACADTLLCVMERHFRDQLAPRRQGHRLNMDIIDLYIRQHISRKISVAQMAGSVFLAESQFHQLFKAQVGMTPHQYVLKKRFDLAQELLCTSELNLTQISDSCGFSSQSGFTSAFSRYFGMSPSRFRQQH
ncbi:AraC family transcriptional regulator [Enterovibrio norvegicus FF-33]|uniref:helix-turn-helix domain-containing protein n=1 Tax=Enterovibrio norvegicus TaxID=188144 RepID=UPI0002FC5065|nr:AraC family transcriptional regulator [Enterovibrio norvegicus]OEE66205.1 AraC family transcriptional regulator [Enterovibrio norvegicus FF-33]